MSLAKKILEQAEGVISSPLKYQQDYRFQTTYPIKQIDMSSLPEEVVKLFEKYSYAGLSLSAFYTLTAQRPQNVDKIRKSGNLLGKKGDWECWTYNSDLIFTDGKKIYSSSQQTLIFLCVSK